MGETLTTPQQVIRFWLGELDADGLADVETTFQLEDLQPGEYVYVRVVESGDGAAWSSPFFVF